MLEKVPKYLLPFIQHLYFSCWAWYIEAWNPLYPSLKFIRWIIANMSLDYRLYKWYLETSHRKTNQIIIDFYLKLKWILNDFAPTDQLITNSNKFHDDSCLTIFLLKTDITDRSIEWNYNFTLEHFLMLERSSSHKKWTELRYWSTLERILFVQVSLCLAYSYK